MTRHNNHLLALWSDSRTEHLDQRVSEVAMTHLDSPSIAPRALGPPFRKPGGPIVQEVTALRACRAIRRHPRASSALHDLTIDHTRMVMI